MVLKGVTKYSFCNKITNVKGIGLNFDTIWAPIVVTSDMSSSRLLPLLLKLLCFLCVFENAPNLVIDGHSGPAGIQWVVEFEM